MKVLRDQRSLSECNIALRIVELFQGFRSAERKKALASHLKQGNEARPQPAKASNFLDF
jgi:hypothetical protein